MLTAGQTQAKMIGCVGGVLGVYMVNYQPSIAKFNCTLCIINIVSDCIIQVQCMLNRRFF